MQFLYYVKILRYFWELVKYSIQNVKRWIYFGKVISAWEIMHRQLLNTKFFVKSSREIFCVKFVLDDDNSVFESVKMLFLGFNWKTGRIWDITELLTWCLYIKVDPDIVCCISIFFSKHRQFLRYILLNIFIKWICDRELELPKVLVEVLLYGVIIFH